VYDAIRRKAAQQAAAGAYARYEQLQFVYRILKQSRWNRVALSRIAMFFPAVQIVEGGRRLFNASAVVLSGDASRNQIQSTDEEATP
jgi:hypothetical protein